MGFIIKHPDPIMRRNLSERMWNSLSPFRAISNAVLLVDDGFNLGVNRLAKRLRDRTGVSRNTLIYGTAATGTALNVSAVNVIAGWDIITTAVYTSILGTLSFFVGRLLVKISNKEHSPKDSKVVSEPNAGQSSMATCFVRASILLFSLHDAISGSLSNNFGRVHAGLLLFFMAISMHIATKANATIDRLQNFLKEARGETANPEMQSGN